MLGVLIALGFEHFVELAHGHNKVNETKETLQDSIGLQAFAAIEQLVVGPCVIQQLDALEK